MVRFAPTRDSGESTENPRSITLKYLLDGIFEHPVAKMYAIASTLPVYDGLYRQDVKLQPIGFNLWNVTVPYGPEKKPAIGECTWAVDTTGGTAHITQSLETIQRYAPAGKTATDHKGAIGINKEGDVEGCDIVIPSCKWTETWNLSAAAASFAYIDTLEALTGHVNNATFRGKPAGEVRFDGATGGGSTKDPTMVVLTFHFVRSKSVTGITAGDITGIAKDGWQYLWYEYSAKADATAKATARRPRAAHVERVYDSADFSLLGIGTASLPAVQVT